MALTTTAIMPASAFTTPLRLIWSMARQRLPMLQPEPTMLRLTTGLTNGSRRPVRLITLGSCFLATSGVFLSWTATFCLEFAGLAAFTAFASGATDLLAGLVVFVARAGVEGFAFLAAVATAVLLATRTAATPVFEWLLAGLAGAATALVFGWLLAGLAGATATFFPLTGAAGFAGCPCEAASAAFESIAFFCSTAFIVFRVFSMTSGFCPQAEPAAIPSTRIPVVSFIGLPTFLPARSGRAEQKYP